MNKENMIQRFDKMQQQAPASIILLSRLELSGRRGLMHW